MSGSQKLAGRLDAFALGCSLWAGFDEGRTLRHLVPRQSELYAPAMLAHRQCPFLASLVTSLLR